MAYSGEIIYKNGAVERSDAIRARAIELIAAKSGYSHHLIGCEIYLTRSTTNREIFAFMFRNLCVKVRLDPSSAFLAHARLDADLVHPSNVSEEDILAAPKGGIPHKSRWNARR